MRIYYVNKIEYTNNLMTIFIPFNHHKIDGEICQYNTSGEMFSKTTYKNGNIITQAMYEHGVLNGEYRKWFNNNQLEECLNYKNGKLNGSFIKWFNNSYKVQSCGNYKNDKLNGIYTEYDKNGNIISICDYKEGVKI